MTQPSLSRRPPAPGHGERLFEIFSAQGPLEARNRRLTTAGYADDWVIYASGAAAFVLAHEMGHLALGAQDVEMRRRPMRFDFTADRDLHWACPDLIQEKFAHQEQIERAADEFAVDVLSRVSFPSGVLNKTMLRYELGARWYTSYGASEQMVQSLEATESEVIRASLRNEFGAVVFDVLVARKVEPGDGTIQVFFPETHPLPCTTRRPQSRAPGALAEQHLFRHPSRRGVGGAVAGPVARGRMPAEDARIDTAQHRPRRTRGLLRLRLELRYPSNAYDNAKDNGRERPRDF